MSTACASSFTAQAPSRNRARIRIRLGVASACIACATCAAVAASIVDRLACLRTPWLTAVTIADRVFSHSCVTIRRTETMTSASGGRRLVVIAVCSAPALVLTSAAAAHSSISPPVAKAKTLQQFTLEVQAEKENARTTRVEVAFPDGFNVETFPATPGWKRSEFRQGSGDQAPVQSVIWSGSEKSPRA